MKKWMALLLAMGLLLALTACGEVSPEEDAATVVAEVNGEAITKGEATPIYEAYTQQTISYYSALGSAVDAANASFITDMKTTTLNMLAEGLALSQKAEELRLSLTEEEMAEVETESQASFDEMVQSYMESYGVDEATAEQAMENQGYSLEILRYLGERNAVEEKLYDHVVADVSVGEEEIQASYDELVATAQQTYADNPGQYGSDVSMGSTIYVRPEGYRYIKNLVIALPEETQTQVTELENELYQAMQNQYYYQDMLSYQGPSMDAETLLRYNNLVDTYTQEIANLQTQIDNQINTGKQQVLAQAEEVLALCQAEGADFDALMEEYNDDTVTDESILANGYPVCAESATYVAEFTDAAMALQAVGDISGLVETDYGYHILMYAGDVDPGVTPLEEVHDAIADDLLAQKQSDAYEAAYQQWLDDANIRVHVNKL